MNFLSFFSPFCPYFKCIDPCGCRHAVSPGDRAPGDRAPVVLPSTETRATTRDVVSPGDRAHPHIPTSPAPTETRMSFSGSGTEDKDINLVNLAAPVMELYFMTIAHDCD